MSINKDLVAASSTALVLAILAEGRGQLADERRQWRTVDKTLGKIWS
jgi:hypothetical protein